jgi:hypothetical protein
MHLYLSAMLIKPADVDLLFKPVKSTMSVLGSAHDASRHRYGGCDLHFVDFSWRPTCNLWEDEPSDNNDDCTCTREALTQKKRQAFLLIIAFSRWGTRRCTYKKPVLTPHLWVDVLLVPLIISGVQKLNIMPMRLDKARDQAAVRARRRCWGISAA